MWRYLWPPLTIGILAAALAGFLAHLGWGDALCDALWNFYGLEPSDASFPLPIHYAVTGILALFIAWTTVDIPRPSHKTIILLFAIFLLFSASWVAALFAWRFNPWTPLSGMVLGYLFGWKYASTERGKRKRLYRRMFGDRLSRSQFQRLLQAKESIDFAGEQREVTILVCHLFNSLHLRHQNTPTELLEWVNRFHEYTANFLIEKGAFLDQSNPDSIRAFWGAPVLEDEHAAQACRVALELQQRLDNFSKEYEYAMQEPLQYGMALVTGECIFGRHGHHVSQSYTGMGAKLDLSRRLLLANEHYGTKLLIDEKTYLDVKTHLEVRPVDLFFDVHEKEILEIYELLAESNHWSERQKKQRDEYWKAILYYRKNELDAASSLLEKLAEQHSGDPLVEYYLQKCRMASRSNTSQSAASLAKSRALPEIL